MKSFPEKQRFDTLYCLRIKVFSAWSFSVNIIEFKNPLKASKLKFISWEIRYSYAARLLTRYSSWFLMTKCYKSVEK